MTKPPPDKPKSDLTDDRPQIENKLSVRELAQFLRDVGKSLQRPTYGPVLGEALVQLSAALRHHHDKELEELLDFLKGRPAFPKNEGRRRPKPLDGVDLQTLELNQLNELLSNDHLSKQDLVEVGSKRLGISKSSLVRQNKQSIRETLTSALENEEAYHVISKEAEREGTRRAQVQRLM